MKKRFVGILIHPTANANVRSVLKSFEQNGLLYLFFISVALTEGRLIIFFSKFISDLRKRFFEKKYLKYIKQYPFKEFFRLLFQKLNGSMFIKHEKGIFCIDAVYTYIDQKASNWIKKNYSDIDFVYAYEDGALNSFKIAKKNNKICIYDLPIGYYKASRILMEAEFSKNIAWKSTFTGFKDSKEKLHRKDQEIAHADYIIVASSFTKYTLEQYYTYSSLPPIKVIPYGFPQVNKSKVYDYNGENRKLKLLFVGGLSQRKGIANVIEAVQQLKEQVSLTIIGKKSVQDCDALNQAVIQHHWIPSLSHAQILEQMRLHDILLFPSLFEGFGLVITEAMSQGTPVITTDRTIGGDFINHNINGWLVPSGDTHAMVTQIKDLIKNPLYIATNGENARLYASTRPWSAYERDLSVYINSIQ